MDDSPLDEQTDAAIEALLPVGVSAGGLIEAMDDPAVFPPMARGDMYRLMAYKRTMFENPNFTIPQRLEYMRVLMKVAGLEAREEMPTAANLPSVKIIFQNHPPVSMHAQPRTIDITPDDD